ncbi:MAG: hypothetical protein GX900_01245 [Clostridiaceae bacterium]|nr:hypothetical protein [Clostridiaceae bacterium]
MTAKCREYTDFPVVEWLVCFENTGRSLTPCLSELRLDVLICDAEDKDFVPNFRYGKGDSGDEYCFEEYLDPLDHKFVLAPVGGRPCNGVSPYMRLLFPAWGVNIAVGWPGQWQAEIEPAQGGARFAVGQQYLKTVLLPGESLRLPRLTLMGFVGAEERGVNVWRRWYLKYMLPRSVSGTPLQPYSFICRKDPRGEEDNGEHVFDTIEFHLEGVSHVVGRNCKPDGWWLDAGWYQCDNWRDVGSHYPDRRRFPDGLQPLGKLCADNGIDFLLWFEYGRCRPGTELAEKHPEWMLSRRRPDLASDLQYVENKNMRYLMDSYVVDLGNEDCFQWMLKRLDAVIKESGVSIFREDLNIDPLMFWLDNDESGRMGMKENRYCVNFLRLWQELLQRNPGLWIDSCASGGRRNDLETLRSPAVPLHYTDMYYGHHPKKQVQQKYMFSWIPYFMSRGINWDDAQGLYPGEAGYDERSCRTGGDMFSHLAVLSPAISYEYPDSEELVSVVQNIRPIWRQAAHLMLTGDYYPLTECRASSADWYAYQMDEPESKKGFMVAVRNTRAETDEFVLRPRLEDKLLYRFENALTGEQFELTGEEAGRGITISLDKRSATVIFYEAYDV